MDIPVGKGAQYEVAHLDCLHLYDLVGFVLNDSVLGHAVFWVEHVLVLVGYLEDV